MTCALTSCMSMRPCPEYMFPKMTAVGDGMYRLPDGYPRIPLSFSLKATKPAG